MTGKNPKKLWLYCGLAAIFVAGVYVASRPEVGDFVRILAGTPAVCSLLGALFLLLRDDIAFERKLLHDELAHERSRALQDSRNTFSIGATSHMANIAFDKHIGFCEEYVKQMIEMMWELLKSGPDEKALNAADALVSIRYKWLVWLNPKTESFLESFEHRVRGLGADAWLLKHGGPMEDRHEVVKPCLRCLLGNIGNQGFRRHKGLERKNGPRRRGETQKGARNRRTNRT